MADKTHRLPTLKSIKGIWHFCWNDGEAHKESFSTRDLSVAQARFVERLERHLGSPAKDSNLTVSTALNLYLNEHVQPNLPTSQYVENCMMPLHAYFGHMPLKNVGVPECRGYYNARKSGVLSKGKPAMSSTAGKELRVLRAAANHAVKWKHMLPSEMPTFDITAEDAGKGAWLFPDELKRLRIAAASIGSPDFPMRTLAFVDIAYFTGARKDAVETLEWYQVDMDKGRIDLLKRNTKQTKKRRPTVPIDPRLRAALNLCAANRKDDYVIRGGNAIDYAFQKAAAIAGLSMLPERNGRPEAPLTPHVLRHSRASHLLQDGKPIWTVAKLLGDSVVTVERVYGHHSTDNLHGLFSSLPEEHDELYENVVGILQ